jgi:hypothetical protein
MALAPHIGGDGDMRLKLCAEALTEAACAPGEILAETLERAWPEAHRERSQCCGD